MVPVVVVSVPVIVSVIVSVLVSVVVPVSLAFAVVFHVAKGRTATPASIIDHATGDRTGRQQSKKYRCNELVHIGSLYKRD
jgi:hypothetical protein